MERSETVTREGIRSEAPEEPDSAGPTADPDVVAPAGRIGRFCILRLVGAGGMGRVYAAYDPDLDRRVAIKVLHRRGQAPTDDKRLLREAQALARLSHPNVVTVHDVGIFRGRAFVAMEYVEGVTLAEWARSKAAESGLAREYLDVLIQAGLGLCAAHRAGIVHRDFKPSNVLVGLDQRVRVVDFGLARGDAVGRDEEALVLWAAEALKWPSGTLGQQITASGALIGTPRYMAPEQLLCRNPTPAADQFAFAAVAWELLSGAVPFGGKDPGEQMAKVRRGNPDVPITMPGIGPRIIEALRRGLQFEPKRRHPRLDDLVEIMDAERFGLASRPRRSRRAVAMAGAMMGLAGVVAVVMGSRPDDACSSGEEMMSSVWSGEVSDDLRTALESSGAPFGAQLWQEARTQFDALSGEWVRMYADTCQATRRGEQSAELLDLRMDCLGVARSEMDAAIHLLQNGDRQLLGTGWQLLPSAGLVKRCGNLGWLQSRGRKPADPELAASVTSIREELAKAELMITAGKAGEVRPESERLVAQAELTGFEAVLLEARLVQAKTLAQQGDFQPAEAIARDVYVQALSHQLSWLVPNAVQVIVGILNTNQTGSVEAEWFARLAVGTASGLGDPGTEAVARTSLSTTLYVLGRYTEAAEEAAEAVELLTKSGASASRIVASRSFLTHALMDAGRIEEARTLMDELEPLVQTTFGPTHPETGEFVRNRAGLAFYDGQYLEATPWFRRAVELSLVMLGDEHPVYWMDRLNLAMILEAQGAYAEALQEIDAVLEHEVRTGGELHFRTAEAHQIKGNILFYLVRYDDAAEQYRAALAGFLAQPGENHRGVAQARANLGNCYFEKGDLSMAEAEHQMALEVAKESYGSNHPTTASMRVNLANALAGQGRSEAAAAEYGLAIETYRATTPSGSPGLASALERLGELHLGQGRANQAEPLFREALGIRQRGGDAAGYRGRSALLLAKALDANDGDRTEILRLLQTAQTDLRAAGAAFASLEREVQALLAQGPAQRGQGSPR